MSTKIFKAEAPKSMDTFRIGEEMVLRRSLFKIQSIKPKKVILKFIRKVSLDELAGVARQVKQKT